MALPAVIPLLGQIITWIWIAIKWAWPLLRAVLIWLGILAAQTVIVKELWEQAFAEIDQMATGYTARVVDFQPLALLNAFFPLSELASMVSGYGVFVGACVAVRIMKAFINARKA